MGRHADSRVRRRHPDRARQLPARQTLRLHAWGVKFSWEGWRVMVNSKKAKGKAATEAQEMALRVLKAVKDQLPETAWARADASRVSTTRAKMARELQTVLSEHGWRGNSWRRMLAWLNDHLDALKERDFQKHVGDAKAAAAYQKHEQFEALVRAANDVGFEFHDDGKRVRLRSQFWELVLVQVKRLTGLDPKSVSPNSILAALAEVEAADVEAIRVSKLVERLARHGVIVEFEGPRVRITKDDQLV